jgi:hypothetical protein
MPLLVMVDVPWRQVFAYLASDAVLFVSGWYWYATAHPFTPPASVAEQIFVLAVFARCIVLIAIASYAARRGRRRWPAAPDLAPVPVTNFSSRPEENDRDSVGTPPYSGQQMTPKPNRG